MCFAPILRKWRKMIQLLLNKTTPQIQLLPMPLPFTYFVLMRRRLYSKQKVKEYLPIAPWRSIHRLNENCTHY